MDGDTLLSSYFIYLFCLQVMVVGNGTKVIDNGSRRKRFTSVGCSCMNKERI